ncbi:uncharacterized protein with PhoU and TrkA domain [Paraburkholderia sp. Clong3]|uniref:hypothetical protein n=1 Tax=Paraburkholderia sp. Clong3 TaxID=2991061 RepID=UPI003D221B7F
MKSVERMERMVRGLEQTQNELIRMVAQFDVLQKRVTALSAQAMNDPAAAEQLKAIVKATTEPDSSGKSLKEQTSDVIAAVREADRHSKILKKQLSQPADVAPVPAAAPAEKPSRTKAINRRFA